MEPFGGGLYLNAYDQSGDYAVEPLEVNAIAHRQIGTHLKIPAAYYDKMLEEYPRAAGAECECLVPAGAGCAYGSHHRRHSAGVSQQPLPAYRQPRYCRDCPSSPSGDGRDALRELPAHRQPYVHQGCQHPLEAEVVPGDIVQSGIIISNSEVGLGSVSIQPLVYRLVCSNGMVVNDAQTRRNHVGRVNEASENYQLYSEKTLEADDKAFAMKIQDTVRAVVDEVRFTRVVNMMLEAKDAPMNTAAVPGIVKLVSKDFHITDDESSGVLQRLIEGNDLTLYGLSNAVTRHSQDVKDYDRQPRWKASVTTFLSMPARQWSRINQMAA